MSVMLNEEQEAMFDTTTLVWSRLKADMASDHSARTLVLTLSALNHRQYVLALRCAPVRRGVGSDTHAILNIDGLCCVPKETALRQGAVKPRVMSVYWGAHQRFFKQLCMAMKVPSLVTDGLQALAAGHSVIIGLQSTGEASMVAAGYGEKGTRVRDFPSTCKEILRGFVSANFPVLSAPSMSATGEQVHPMEIPSCVQLRDDLLTLIASMPLPPNSLDALVDAFGGPGNVAEMTGRSNRVVRGADGKLSVESRHTDSKMETLNVQESGAFMQGKKTVAIISDAASTGISLHADSRAANQRRRIHYTIELAWSADKAIQQLGRSHRSNATSGPIYKLLTTNVGGESRFAAAVAQRLESLGALTKGDRRAATGQDLSQYNVQNNYGRKAVKDIVNATCIASMLVPRVTVQMVIDRAIATSPPSTEATAMRAKFEAYRDDMMFIATIGECLNSIGLTEGDKATVTNLLNRIMGLAVHKQNLLFAYFVEVLEMLIAQAKKDGRYSEGVVDVTGEKIEVKGEPKALAPQITHFTLTIDRGVSFQRAFERFKASETKTNFFISKDKQFGRKHYLLAATKSSNKSLVYVTRPNTGESRIEMDKDVLHAKYKLIPRERLLELAAAEDASDGGEAAGEDGDGGSGSGAGTGAGGGGGGAVSGGGSSGGAVAVGGLDAVAGSDAANAGSGGSSANAVDGGGGGSASSAAEHDDSTAETAADIAATAAETIDDDADDDMEDEDDMDDFIVDDIEEEDEDEDEEDDDNNSDAGAGDGGSGGGGSKDGGSTSRGTFVHNPLVKLRREWMATYTTTLTKCVHYGKCKAGAQCTVGQRVSEMNLLCGSIVAAWSPLSRALSSMPGLTDRDKAMKIVRVVTSDSRRVVGLRAPPELLPMIPRLTAYSGDPPVLRIPRPVPDSDYQLMFNSFFQHKFAEWLALGMSQTVAMCV